MFWDFDFCTIKENMRSVNNPEYAALMSKFHSNTYTKEDINVLLTRLFDPKEVF